MKKILTSVFILACCMGGGYGDSICSTDQCQASDTVCKKCSDGNENTVGSVCTGNYVIRATDYLMPHWEGPTQADGDRYISYCYCYKDSIYAECAAGYYGASVYCERSTPTNQTEETWVPDCNFCTTSCTQCPAFKGTPGESNIGTTSATGCKCPADSYMTKDAQDTYYCQGCPEHSNTLGTTGKTKVSQCTCEDGYYMTDSNECGQIKGDNYTDHGNTFSCNKGFYKNADEDACNPCPEYINTKDPGYNEDDPDNSDASAKVNTTTTSSGAKSIQECFIPQGIGFCDEKGCGKYTDNAGHN